MHRRTTGKLIEGAREFYTPLPTEKELAGTGLTLEDYEGDDFEIWPDNWPVWSVFRSVNTQWIYSFNGVEGLNYLALFPLLDRKFKTPDEWDAAFSDIRNMEVAALNAIRSK